MKDALMMVVIVVDLMLIHNIVMNVYAIDKHWNIIESKQNMQQVFLVKVEIVLRYIGCILITQQKSWKKITVHSRKIQIFGIFAGWKEF